MRIPILTYHASRIEGAAYEANDALALQADLRQLTARGFAIRPLHEVATAWLEDPASLEGQRIACLTCDDGTDFDFRDLGHPSHGPQRSVFNILADFRAAHPDCQPGLNITSFVVASPAARADLDRTCLAGRRWWNDDWWASAAGSGLMDIANHSWDHHHDSLAQPPMARARRGTFQSIVTRELADFQIRQAGDYLRSVAPNRGAQLFAYPYGDPNGYLVGDYFPRFAENLDIIAAFTGRAGYLSELSERWAVPRFIFGRDWTSAEGLDRILERVGGD